MSQPPGRLQALFKSTTYVKINQRVNAGAAIRRRFPAANAWRVLGAAFPVPVAPATSHLPSPPTPSRGAEAVPIRAADAACEESESRFPAVRASAPHVHP